MRASLDGAPVISCGQRYSIYPVHDAFVVSGRTVRINLRKIGRNYDAIANLFAAVAAAFQHGYWYSDFSAGDCPVCKIRQNAQEHFAIRHGFDE